MTRAARTKFLKQLSDRQLQTELEEHVRRAAQLSAELNGLLMTEGAAWIEILSVSQEITGHMGRINAICRVALTRKLLPKTKAAIGKPNNTNGATGTAV